MVQQLNNDKNMRHTAVISWLAIGLLALVSLAIWPNYARAGANDIRFLATISDDEQPTPTYSAGKGIAEVVLERETLKLSWTITYQNISSAPFEAGIYGPENVGATAGLQINLSPNGNFASPIKGSAIINEGQLQYFITERMYVNIRTAKWKDGELRGQLQRQPPPDNKQK